VGEQLSLFGDGEGGIDLASLRIERASIAEARRAPATRAAYAIDWASFAGWCSAAGRAALPASSDTLSLYLVAQARSGRAVATVARRVCAIVDRHVSAGLRSPVDDDVREVLAGLRRRLGTASRGKAAISVEELRRMVAARPMVRDMFGRTVPAPVELLARNRALLVLGFASGLRRSELAGLDLVDVDFVTRGLVLRIGRSKTDQEGRGRELGVHRGEHRATCPARALQAWLVERGPWPGPLFCRVAYGGGIRRERLSGPVVAGVVRAAAKLAGLDPARYGAHSLRAGCATAAAELGRDGLAIMRRTGHRSVAMVERYVRHGSLFAVDPLAGAM
jgi:integrase